MMGMPILKQRIREPHDRNLTVARERATSIAATVEYREFVDAVRAETPWRFDDGRDPERFLRGVDSHLENFLPRLLPCVDGEVRSVFDFGCGTGSSIVAAAMVFPEAKFHGVDISRTDVQLAVARAELYGVGDRCRFEYLEEGQALPAATGQCDLCTCFSVLEYVVDPQLRKRAVQELARIAAPGGVLFFAVPNRLYPFEIHSRKFGWNYFPQLLGARMVGSHAWEVQKLARPYELRLYRTPAHQLFTPWTNFGLKKSG